MGLQRNFLSEAEIEKGDGKIFGIDENLVRFNIFIDDVGFVWIWVRMCNRCKASVKIVVSEGFSLTTN